MAELYTLGEVAAQLRVSRRTIERLVAAGRIRVLHPSPGRIVVEEREVAAYVASLHSLIGSTRQDATLTDSNRQAID